MENNNPMEATSNTVEPQQNNGTRNLGVIISFIVVLLVISVVVIARLYPHATLKQQQSMKPATNVPVANVMYQKPTAAANMNTSNAQLDQDLQNAQSSLNTVDTNLNTANQAISNQSADTPQ